MGRPTEELTMATNDTQTPRPMKVRVILEVEIDRNAVSEWFGYEHNAADVREYVRRAAEGAAQSELERIGATVALTEAQR